jgi:hypothetical protein
MLTKETSFYHVRPFSSSPFLRRLPDHHMVATGNHPALLYDLATGDIIFFLAPIVLCSCRLVVPKDGARCVVLVYAEGIVVLGRRVDHF